MRKQGRVDANQPKIVEALRRIGATVNITSNLGEGFPDIVVSFRDEWFHIEIKDGERPPSERRLTDDETRFHKKQRAPVYIVESSLEAVDLLTDDKTRLIQIQRWRDLKEKP